MSDSQGVFTQQLEALSRGVEAARDPFTYKAGAVSLIPPVVLIILAALSIRNRVVNPSSNPLDALTSILEAGVGWFIIILVVAVLTSLWAGIAIAMRAVVGYDSSSAGLFTAAAARLPTALGAFLLILLAGAVLFAVTWLLEQISGLAILSLIVVILAIPLAIFWAVFALTAIISQSFIPALAAADTKASSPSLLTKLVGLMTAFPAPTVLMLVLAGGVAFVSALLFVGAAYVAAGAGLNPLAEEMFNNDQNLSGGLVTLIAILLVAIAYMGPWGIFVASITNYARDVIDEPAIIETPRRLFGFGWMRVQKVASAAGAAAAAARERVAEAAERAGEAAAASAEQSAAEQASASSDQVPGSPDSPAEPASADSGADVAVSPPAEESVSADAEASGPSCPHCGAENPIGYRFCKNCGKGADAPSA